MVTLAPGRRTKAPCPRAARVRFLPAERRAVELWTGPACSIAPSRARGTTSSSRGNSPRSGEPADVAAVFMGHATIRRQRERSCGRTRRHRPRSRRRRSNGKSKHAAVMELSCRADRIKEGMRLPFEWVRIRGRRASSRGTLPATGWHDCQSAWQSRHRSLGLKKAIGPPGWWRCTSCEPEARAWRP